MYIENVHENRNFCHLYWLFILQVLGLFAETTFTILPSAGEITVFLISGVTLSGSLKKYTHQRESKNPIHPKKSENKDSNNAIKKNNAMNG